MLTPVPGSAPTTSQTGALGSPPTGAPVRAADPVFEAAAQGVVGRAETAIPSALPTEMMSGMASAFGAVGGMIGSVVAPLAAVLTGAVGAAGQSLSTLTSADVAASADGTAGSSIAAGPLDIESTDDPDLPGPAAGASEGSDQAPAGVSAESEELQTQPTDILEPARPPVPPAAIRPPQ